MEEYKNVTGAKTHILVEQYANQVLDFSSQYGSDMTFSYTAANCLGRPVKFPAYGDFPPTFVMKEYGPWWELCPSGRMFPKINFNSSNREVSFDNFIDLKFDHSVYVYAVYVYETFNPGAITGIYGGNSKGNWKKLWTGRIQNVGHKPRVFSPPISTSDFPINQIRLLFNQYHLPYYTAIDAVALLGTFEPATSEARLLSTVPDNRGPILDKVVKRKLYKCATEIMVPVKQLLSYNLKDIGYQIMVERSNIEEETEDYSNSDDGPFNNVPREIMFQIFSYLDLYSLVQCCQVSRLFRGIASDPLHYADVNLKPMFYCASNDTLKYLFSKAHYLQRLDLSWCGNYGKMSPKVLRSFLCGRGIHVTSLIMSNCHVVTHEVFAQLGNSCPKLQELNLSNCHTLDVNSLVYPENMRQLKSLNLYRTNILTTELKRILVNNNLLESLNIGACSKLDADAVCAHLVKHNRKLKCLDLWRHLSLTARGVHALSHLPELVDVDLGWCTNVDANTGCIVALVRNCLNISKLFLTAHRQTADRDILAIQEYLPELEYLNIMGTRNVSANAVENLAKSFPDLLLLDIGYCEQLEDQTFLTRLKRIRVNELNLSALTSDMISYLLITFRYKPRHRFIPISKMNQAEITRLISGLKINIGKRPIKYKNAYGPRGALENLRPSVTSLIIDERIEMKSAKGALTRQYTECLISEAILHGDKHQPTMEVASWWLDSDRSAVHKLFKVLVPRFKDYTTSYTKMFHQPTNIITTFKGNLQHQYGDRVTVELRGNPYPKLQYSNTTANKKTIHNVLLAEAAKDYRLDTK